MRILYAIQGTGNGHISRALEIIPYLKMHGDLDILVSGTSFDIELPYPIKYRFKGLSFVFGKKGGVDIWRTYLKMNSKRLIKDVKKLPVTYYDLVISDFEPISSWACRRANKPCIGLSNQVATLNPLAPMPKKSDALGKYILKHYAPTFPNYGFHFKAIDSKTFTPIIRKAVREAIVTDEQFYTVYLPSYDDKRIIKNLKKFPNAKWRVYSKHTKKETTKDNITMLPIDGANFLKSMAACKGVLCNAGFGTTSEALFLHKKLLVIPMKTQYEQHCNAAMLSEMGVPIMKSLKKKHHQHLKNWLNSDNIVNVDFADNAKLIVATIIEENF